MFRDMLFLSSMHPGESHAITVDHIQRLTDLREPKIEVRHLSGQLMPVQRDEPRQLVADEFRKIRRECHATLNRAP